MTVLGYNVSTNSDILYGSSADAQQHSFSYNQSLEGLVVALRGSELMSTVLTTSLISHAAGNKNGISINQECSACGGVGSGCIELCVCVGLPRQCAIIVCRDREATNTSN